VIVMALGMGVFAFISAGQPAWARTTATDGIYPIIHGTVHLQGRPAPPAPSWSIPLDVVLECSGGTLPGVYPYATTTDQQGIFVITHAISYTSICDIRVKNPHTLRNVKYGVTLNAGDNNIDFGTLREGDANNDNRVSLVDFSILATAYDTGPADAHWDARADFNENDWIEIADFSLLATNYDRSGDIPVEAPLAGLAATEATTVTLKLVPSSWVAAVGDIFTIDLRLDPHGQPFQGVAVYLDFDPNDLEVVDAAGNPATAIEDSGILPTVLHNQVDNAGGEIRFSAGLLGEASPTEEFSLATIRFKAKQVNFAGSAVTFIIQDYPPRTGVTYEGYYLPLEVENLNARLAQVRFYWPLLMREARTLPPE